MPLIVKDYTWSETELQIFISIPLKGIKASKVDIFSTENYVKVNYPPYLFECFLFAAVDDLKSVVQYDEGMVTLKLNKLASQLWGSLQSYEAVDNKEKQRELREAAVKRAQERTEELKQKQDEMKREQHKFSVSQQMKVEDEERARIESLKEAERRKTAEDMEIWKEKQRLEAIEEAKLAKQRQIQIQSSKKCKETATNKNGSDVSSKSVEEINPRQSGKISVKFTERHFPTPSRESLAADEDAWLKKQAEARQTLKAADEELTEEERNPLWLRDKGNSFFAAGNYQAAINAFTHAIRLDAKMPALFSNRAACHLKLGNYFKCIEDASKAVELLTPPVEQNAAARKKAHVRRGTAFCQLEMYAEGLLDYEAALKIDSADEQLKSDAHRIRNLIEGRS